MKWEDVELLHDEKTWTTTFKGKLVIGKDVTAEELNINVLELMDEWNRQNRNRWTTEPGDSFVVQVTIDNKSDKEYKLVEDSIAMGTRNRFKEGIAGFDGLYFGGEGKLTAGSWRIANVAIKELLLEGKKVDDTIQYDERKFTRNGTCITDENIGKALKAV
ncbi:hypothetical protein SAMN02910358_02342 [Lachnospiraceae bacterium XBB1006]|nr:hypothetical protein SAMN02910358_02342 [Lachnospiraceae bacterium XBB1006]